MKTQWNLNEILIKFLSYYDTKAKSLFYVNKFRDCT